MECMKEKIEEAELILVGIGEKFASDEKKEKIEIAYQNLARLLEGKNYFIVTTCVDDGIYKAGLKEDRIVRPLAPEENVSEDKVQEEPEKRENERVPRWETYMKWLQGTLNKKLFVLELGVGLKYPEIIRFPFEKIAYFNQKADFVRVHDRLFQLPAELNGKGSSVQADPIQLLIDVEI